MGIDFKMNASFENEFFSSDAAKQQLESVGPDMVREAVRLAPDDPHTLTNDLKSKISFEVIKSEKTNAFVGRLLSADFKSNWLHEGTSRITARPFLRQAVESQGFKIQAPVE